MAPMHDHGLAFCRYCAHPVAPPVGVLERSLFRFSRCPGCGGLNPHPQELQEFEHTFKTIAWGASITILAVVVLSYAPLAELLTRLNGV